MTIKLEWKLREPMYKWSTGWSLTHSDTLMIALVLKCVINWDKYT